MKWLLLLLFFTGCTIEVRPIKDKKPRHRVFHYHVKPSPTPDPTPGPLSKLAPLIREKSED